MFSYSLYLYIMMFSASVETEAKLCCLMVEFMQSDMAPFRSETIKPIKWTWREITSKHRFAMSKMHNPEPGLERFLIEKFLFQAGPLFHM